MQHFNIKKPYLCTLLFSISLLSACTTIPDEPPTRKSKFVATSFEQALENTHVITLTRQQAYLGLIKRTDATLQTDFGPAYYKIFRLPTTKNYGLQIKSLCDCSPLTLNKTVMPASAYFLDSSGTPLNKIKFRKYGVYGGFDPNRHEAKLYANDIPESATYLFVGTDTKSASSKNQFFEDAVDERAENPLMTLMVGIEYSFTGEIHVNIISGEKPEQKKRRRR